MAMKWFDRGGELRVSETLTPEQAAYLVRPSVTIFGPLNVLVRKHWDLLLLLVIVGGLGQLTEQMLGRAQGDTFAERIGNADVSTLALILLTLILFLGIAHFGITHGRRLAWNRSLWRDFAAFQTSEGRWTPWGYAALCIGVVATVVGLIITP